MAIIGRLGYLIDVLMEKERDFKWKIENFASLSTEKGQFYDSPSFSFAGASWCLRIGTNGNEDQDSESSVGYIDIWLFRETSGPPMDIDFSLILKLSNGEILRNECFSLCLTNKYDEEGTSKFLKRSEFLEKTTELGLPDTLIVIFTMKCDVIEMTTQDDNGDLSVSETAGAKCSNCNRECDAEAISYHEGKCSDKSIRCPECCDVVNLKDWYDHECQKFRTEASEKLSDDFKKMMLNGNNTDTIIKVKGQEFRLHRDILVTRNSYFSSMFNSNMKEKRTGIVSVNDCEPEIFRIFMQFIYTGKTDKLSAESMCDLYEIADKYQEDQLKKECLHFMMKSLSEDIFFDCIVLALKHDEKELFEKSVEFFTLKPKEIVGSAKWHSFAKEYPRQASELFIKTLNQYIK